jgi:FtsH-binding integral membrane protein
MSLMKIKKNILGLILVLPLIAITLGMPLMAIGQAADDLEELPDVDLMATLENIADWLFYLLLGVAVVFIVIGGFYYVMAQGDPEKIQKAGQMILYALIGVIVASLAKGLVKLVQYFPTT